MLPPEQRFQLRNLECCVSSAERDTFAIPLLERIFHAPENFFAGSIPANTLPPLSCDRLLSCFRRITLSKISRTQQCHVGPRSLNISYISYLTSCAVWGFSPRCKFIPWRNINSRWHPNRRETKGLSFLVTLLTHFDVIVTFCRKGCPDWSNPVFFLQISD